MYSSFGPEIYALECDMPAPFIPNIPLNNCVAYPNPCDNYIKIEINSLSNLQQNLTIFDVLGKIVIQQQIKNGSNYIDVSSLPKGLYFFKTNGFENQKIIKY
jgi:hypothetical protein